MNKTQQKTAKRTARHNRIRAKVKGTAQRPRLAVFRSNQYLYAQLIDDDAGKTIGAADTRKAKGKTAGERATEVANTIAEQAKKAKVEAVVFDRGGFPYKGTISIFSALRNSVPIKLQTARNCACGPIAAPAINANSKAMAICQCSAGSRGRFPCADSAACS